MAEEEGDKFQLMVLRSAVVESEVDAFVKKLRESPDKVQPHETIAAIRRWFAAAEYTNAWLRMVETWADAKVIAVDGNPVPVIEEHGAHVLWGPLNKAWRDLFIRFLTMQFQQRMDNMDPASQLGAMGSVPK